MAANAESVLGNGFSVDALADILGRSQSLRSGGIAGRWCAVGPWLSGPSRIRGRREGTGIMRLAIVGGGPMALYLLKHLQHSPTRLEIEIFEASDDAGSGMPYRAGMNADDMLCNAFSREIPHVTQPLIDWLEKQPARELGSWELSVHELSPRAFYPRVLIGQYLQSEFRGVCERLRAAGHAITVSTRQRVTDIIPEEGGFTLRCSTEGGSRGSFCDDVVLATGHVWPTAPEIDGIELVSPWPYTNFTGLPPTEIGVLGSSLSAIDVVIALGGAHGDFEEQPGEQIRWLPGPHAEELKISMVSFEGIMPEGDFYYPYPYTPLTHITEEAVRAEVAAGPDGLLERIFALLCRELDHSDPDYLRELGGEARSIEGFGEAYFARRQRLGGLRAVKRDLAETRASMRQKRTIPHRYALLRGHESFERALRALSEHDYATFQQHLMPVFADCYAAVPHLSLARVIALYDAGVLTLHATGENSTFRRAKEGGIEVSTADGEVRFDRLIDARGQAAHPLSALPFPSLVDRMTGSDRAVIEPFRLETGVEEGGRIYCLAMPQILDRYPFSQGLPNCHELSGIVVADLIGSAGGTTGTENAWNLRG